MEIDWVGLYGNNLHTYSSPCFIVTGNKMFKYRRWWFGEMFFNSVIYISDSADNIVSLTFATGDLVYILSETCGP